MSDKAPKRLVGRRRKRLRRLVAWARTPGLPPEEALAAQLFELALHLLQGEDDEPFTCLGCGWTVSSHFGCADDLPDHCADCWCAQHEEAA